MQILSGGEIVCRAEVTGESCSVQYHGPPCTPITATNTVLKRTSSKVFVTAATPTDINGASF